LEQYRYLHNQKKTNPDDKQESTKKNEDEQEKIIDILGGKMQMEINKIREEMKGKFSTIKPIPIPTANVCEVLNRNHNKEKIQKQKQIKRKKQLKKDSNKCQYIM